MEVKIILILANNPDHELVRELEENKCHARFIEKPIELANLIEIVPSTVS
jgi:hypothetical protein